MNEIIYDLGLLSTSARELGLHLLNLSALEKLENEAAKTVEIRKLRKLCNDSQRDLNRALFSLGITQEFNYEILLAEKAIKKRTI